jgi:FkbM family methyltransferase
MLAAEGKWAAGEIEMAETTGRLANLFLRYASPIAGLRRVPVVGDCLSWISGKLVPRGTLVWVQVQQGPAQGLWICVNPRTGKDVRQGMGEPLVQQALVENIRPGQVFYDLGANIGFFSLLAARLVGATGRVVSFEADPEIAARLRENLAYNKFLQAIVEQKAVWSQPGTIRFARVAPNTSPDRGLGHVETDRSAASETISVEAVSLDQYTALNQAPDFMKCDVEGAESAVFEGAERLLSEKRPGLLIEMHSPQNHKQLSRKFQQLGYTCLDLDENHVLALPR